MRSYEQSQAWLARAKAATPGGSQTGSKAPGRAGPSAAYPLFLERGNGCRVEDVDGNSYVDMVASLAAVGLGHRHPSVRDAVAGALDRGTILSLPTREEALASEHLCQFVGWPDQARWVKTGSEATEAAVRIARAATGRTLILTIQSGYHSWHSWFQGVKPQHPGVPEAVADLIVGMEYGRRIDTLPILSDFAAVILEPAPITGGGDAAWLKEIRRECTAAGTVLVFDEVVWGFRLARAGGTDYFGVQPDLACYGKALGNGVPVAAVVGGRDLMKHASLVSGTYGGDRLGLAAAMAVIDAYRNDALGRMWENAEAFVRGVEKVERVAHVTLACSGYPVHPVLSVRVEAASEQVAMSYFLQRLAANGLLWHPAGGNVMACMSWRDVSDAVCAVAEAYSDVAVAASDRPLAEALQGEPYQQAFARAR